MHSMPRRDFLKELGGSVVVGAGAWATLEAISPPRAADAQVTPEIVQYRPEMEAVVQWIERTPRERAFEVAAEQLKAGLSYRNLLAGVFLAGIRNIKPRPVGFKFHAVMAVEAAHQLALDAPQADRLLPLFWALDNFKSSQAQDVKEGDWTLGPVKESAVPSPSQARKRFVEAMDAWDEEGADVAVAGLCRAAGVGEIMDLLWQYGGRDWQNIGHKIIFTAHACRTLNTIGWEHAEPVLRSLVFGLLTGGASDSVKPYASNQALVKQVRPDWSAGKPDEAASRSMLQTLRQATPDEAARAAVEMLNKGVAASSVWDGIMLTAGDLLMRKTGIVSIHATTACNSLHYAFRTSGQDATRLLMLLQACSWIALFREGVRSRDGLPDAPFIDKLEPAAEAVTVDAIFQDLTKNRLDAARRVLALAGTGPAAVSFMDAARHLVFTKGNDSHDYKFAAASFEEFRHANPSARAQLLAASVFYLHGTTDRDSPLLQRTQQALARL